MRLSPKHRHHNFLRRSLVLELLKFSIRYLPTFLELPFLILKRHLSSSDQKEVVFVDFMHQAHGLWVVCQHFRFRPLACVLLEVVFEGSILQSLCSMYLRCFRRTLHIALSSNACCNFLRKFTAAATPFGKDWMATHHFVQCESKVSIEEALHNQFVHSEQPAPIYENTCDAHLCIVFCTNLVRLKLFYC